MNKNSDNGNDERVIVSCLTLRRVVGLLGISLPVLLVLWGFVLCNFTSLQDSISDYYSLRTRDLLVGNLFAIAWFLFTHRGHEKQDDIAGDLACLYALGIAFFPAAADSGKESFTSHRQPGCFWCSHISQSGFLPIPVRFKPRRKRSATEYTWAAASSCWPASS